MRKFREEISRVGTPRYFYRSVRRERKRKRKRNKSSSTKSVKHARAENRWRNHEQDGNSFHREGESFRKSIRTARSLRTPRISVIINERTCKLDAGHDRSDKNLFSLFRYSNAGVRKWDRHREEEKVVQASACERIVNSFETICKWDAIVIKHQATGEMRDPHRVANSRQEIWMATHRARYEWMSRRFRCTQGSLTPFSSPLYWILTSKS